MLSTQSNPKKVFDKINYCEVMKNKRAVFALISITFSLNLFSFVDTILADNLEDVFNLDSSMVSVVYAA